MKYHHPLKKILSQARPYWDRDEMRPAVRRVFGKASQCRNAELGAEVYRSENQELILYHPCKSRACPSCGYAPRYSGCATGGSHCQTRFIRGSHSRCRITFGPFSATTRPWLKLCRP